MRIAFDIDDTLFKLVEDTKPRFPGVGANCPCGTMLTQEVDGMMLNLAHQLALNPENEVFFWSAGGIDHVNNFIRRFCPELAPHITVIQKGEGQNMDVSFDDQPVKLATLNLRIAREHSDHWQLDDETQVM